jgi:hypothetical protein
MSRSRKQGHSPKSSEDFQERTYGPELGSGVFGREADPEAAMIFRKRHAISFWPIYIDKVTGFLVAECSYVLFPV